MTQAATPRVRHWRGLLVVLLVLAAIATIAAAGGFARRTTTTLAVAAGTELDAGNLVFRFDTATVQYRSKTTGDPWLVVVSGSVRNPHDESLAPLTGAGGNLFGLDLVNRQAVDDPTFLIGATDPAQPWTNRRAVVPPVDRWTELQAEFAFERSYRPGDTFELEVTPMEFTANSILGLSDEPSWNRDSFSRPWTVTVPLIRLPDTDY